MLLLDRGHALDDDRIAGMPLRVAQPGGGDQPGSAEPGAELAAAAAQHCRPQEVRELAGQHQGAARREGAGALTDPNGSYEEDGGGGNAAVDVPPSMGAVPLTCH